MRKYVFSFDGCDSKTIYAKNMVNAVKNAIKQGLIDEDEEYLTIEEDFDDEDDD